MDPQGGPPQSTVAGGEGLQDFHASQQQEHHKHGAPAIANLEGDDHRREPRADKAGSNAAQAQGETDTPSPRGNGSTNQYWGVDNDVSDVSDSRY
jgi:hypothetical protein